MFSFPGQQGHHTIKHIVNGASDTVYDTKYKILSKKCLQVKEETDRIYSNLLRSKKLLRKLLHERRLLAERLERYGDAFCEVDLPQFCDEDFAYEVLLSQKKAINDATSPPTPTSLGSASTSLSRRGSSSSTIPIQQTPPMVSGSSFFESLEVNSTVSKVGKKKSSSGTPRAKKDPEAPRKPVNAYFIFCERRRSDVQRLMVEERQGEVDRKEVTRKLSQLWLDLPQEEKKMFYTLYEIEKTRYDAEMKEYSATKQPSATLPSSTVTNNVLLGLPPPFSCADDDMLVNDQPVPKRAKKANSRNGPGRPMLSSSGAVTPSIPSTDCSPSPSIDTNSNCIASDALLAAITEPNASTSNLITADVIDSAVRSSSMAEDEVPTHLQSSAEDVFLLDTNGDGMECLELPLPADTVVSTLLSSTTTGDDSSNSNGGAVMVECLGNGNGTAGHSSSLSPSSPSQHSGSSQLPIQQGILLDSANVEQPSPPTISNEWQLLPAVMAVTSGDAVEGDNNSSILNASSSTMSPAAGGDQLCPTEVVPPVEATELMVSEQQNCDEVMHIADEAPSEPPPVPEHIPPLLPAQSSPVEESDNVVFAICKDDAASSLQESQPVSEALTNPPTASTEDAPAPEPIADEQPHAAIPTATTADIDVASIPLPPEPSLNFCFGISTSSIIAPPPPPPPPPPEFAP